MSPLADHRLPRGRHGIPREQVLANQRWRLLGACAEVLSERSYAATTVSAVTEVAGVTKSELYRHFEDLPSCVVATHELAAGALLAAAREACSTAAAAGPGTVPFPLPSVLGLLAAEPSLIRVLCNPALLDIPEILSARTRLVQELADLLAGLRGEAQQGCGSGDVRLSLHLIQGMFGWLDATLCSKGIATLPARSRELTMVWGVPPHPRGASRNMAGTTAGARLRRDRDRIGEVRQG